MTHRRCDDDDEALKRAQRELEEARNGREEARGYRVRAREIASKIAAERGVNGYAEMLKTVFHGRQEDEDA